MIKGKEAELMTAMRALQAGGAEAVTAAVTKIDALDQEVKSIRSAVAADSPLASILTKYQQVLSDWRSGLVALGNPDSDRDKSREMLEAGDRLRTEAGGEFDRRYTGPNSRQR